MAKEAFGRAARLLALLFVILGSAVPAAAAGDRLAAPALATASYSPELGIAEAAPDRWAELTDESGAPDQADDAGTLPFAAGLAAASASRLALTGRPSLARAGLAPCSYRARAPPIV